MTPHTSFDTSVDHLVLDGGGGSRAEQLAQHVAAQIAQGELAAGARLPSVRDAARRHQLSPSTVVSAYDQLQAQGLIEAQRQRGFFVRQRAASRAGPGLERSTLSALPHPVDASALIRGMFSTATGRAGPGSGILPASWLDGALLQRALRKVCGRTAGIEAALRYGEPAGDSGLREALSRRLADLGIATEPAQIVTTVGATHALDVVARTLLRPGDAVLIDEPGWAVEFARLSGMGMRLLPVPRGPAGPDLAVMARLAAAHQPKLYVTVSVLHNPTGCSLPLAAAHQVLKLAEAHDFTIVEDDTYAAFAPNHQPRLAALDALHRTVYISGFSKMLAPNWRVGFLAASPDRVARFIETKMISSLTTPAITEQSVAWCLDQGLLRRHVERVIGQLDAARVRTVRLAQQAGCTLVTPAQGLFGWFDTGVDSDALAQLLAAQDWLTAPGSLFHAARQHSTLMRLNFATSQDAAFWRAFSAARQRVRNETDAPPATPPSAATSGLRHAA